MQLLSRSPLSQMPSTALCFLPHGVIINRFLMSTSGSQCQRPGDMYPPSPGEVVCAPHVHTATLDVLQFLLLSSG